MGERDQVRPLAPASERQSSDEEEAALYLKGDSKRRCIKCCGFITAVLLLQAIVIVVLIFTIFKPKDPVIRLNGVTVDKLELVNGTTPKPGSNMTLTADVSVKNPNYAAFKYENTSTSLFYHGMLVGEVHSPPGKSKARRTMRMNVTIDFIVDKLLSQPALLKSDVVSGLLPMTTYTKVGGRVNMMNIFKRHVVVKMNCTVAANITSRTIQDQKCKRKVKL